MTLQWDVEMVQVKIEYCRDDTTEVNVVWCGDNTRRDSMLWGGYTGEAEEDSSRLSVHVSGTKDKITQT